jgi:hypothetical protein
MKREVICINNENNKYNNEEENNENNENVMKTEAQ